ncbi:uncharacterized protein LOC101239856 isoform X1 [Hydra vulgaris]|uniref:uncharacterized protein LOC101239856 isoform X1 n=1 Tax=Hydra vulgaris TaxID=6087 RepID=UPI001F5E758D|nr:uncharacterized protein LOC101239856 [Hydra vulgaris]
MDQNIRQSGIVKFYMIKILQFLHFLVVFGFLIAGIKEFVENPPLFDAYGDAFIKNKLPEGIFENDPRLTQSANMRLLDLPLLVIIVCYVCICVWLKFNGLAWLLTLLMFFAVFVFWFVNVSAHKYFDWRYYSTRIVGLELQIAVIGLVGTSVFMVLVWKRKKLPFKFKSTIPIRHLGPVHVIFNFIAVYFIIFTSMLMWFTKMYISWACFKRYSDTMQICQITNQVQCYSCETCSFDGIKTCYNNLTRTDLFTCNMVQNLKSAYKGAFCIFNYNMSAAEFLTTFAYIGGLCVFLSTFIRIVGHYIFRAVFIIHGILLVAFNRTNEVFQSHKDLNRVVNVLREARRTSNESLIINAEHELNSQIDSRFKDTMHELNSQTDSRFKDTILLSPPPSSFK